MALTKPNGDFEWVQESWGAALRCSALTSMAHCFSTRELTAEAMMAQTLGVEPDSLARMRQVHCADVFVAHKKRDQPWPEADIAVTDNPMLAVCVRTADCVPILLADRRTGAVAAIHAGWKGTAAGAAIVAVNALTSRYGTSAQDVIAAVGPSIGPCCYEVGADLAAHFSSHPEASTWFSRDAKPHLDLWRASRDQLARAGIPPKQIHVCELCTFDHPALFHSFRRDGKSAGRLVSAIRSAPGTTL
jgi:YfiH family protein